MEDDRQTMENEAAVHQALNSSELCLDSGRRRPEPLPPLVKAVFIVLVIVCGLLLILCITLASTRRPGQRCEDMLHSPSEKTWLFAVAHHDVNIAYIDNRTGNIRGFNVDVIQAVCQLARVECDVVWDVETNCWESQSGGPPKGGRGLYDEWYDGCAGWIPTKARNRTFKFTKSYFKGPSEGLWVRKNATAGIQPPINVGGKKIGFVAGWHSDEFCLREQQDIVGFDSDTTNYAHFSTIQGLVQAVNTDQIDYAFCSSHPYLLRYLKPVTSSRVCANEGPAVMHRKDSCLSKWWNPALDKLLTSERYREICLDLKKAHGHMPGGDPSRVCLGNWNS